MKAKKMIRNAFVNMPNVCIHSFRTAVFGLLLYSYVVQANAENSDSSKYWVNRAYLACLKQNRSACDCQKEQEYLVLAVDTAAFAFMAKPSIFFSWEDLHFEFLPVSGKKGIYKVPVNYGIDSFATIAIDSNWLRLRSRTQSADFTPYPFLKTQNNQDVRIQAILKSIHCVPLLKCKLLALPPESAPFAPADFFALVASGRVEITCSDDFGYTEMWIQQNDSSSLHFFMEYQTNEILLYQVPPRNRRQAVDTSKLTPCFKFLKPE